ncbi:MAG TPA: hypothetical protein VLF67_00175 [Candidatus Saccharimonas sp.]|nr:hypothetical protein [Candidatus Saccharimonas sp.]
MLVRIRRPRTAHLVTKRWVVAIAHRLVTPTLFAVTALAAITAAAWLTPGQHVETLGQDLIVGARHPSFSLSGPGEMIVHGTPMDIVGLSIFGPVRPRIELPAGLERGPKLAAIVQPATSHAATQTLGTDITHGFVRWYLLATGLVIAFAVLLFGLIAHFRWRGWKRKLMRLSACLLVTLVLWAGFAVSATNGARDLANVTSLDDLVGHGLLHLAPQPVGPKLHGYQAVVIGDSRVSRVGGLPLDKPTPDDQSCDRSRDSLAGIMSGLLSWNVLNLACPSATIEQGLMGSQPRGGRDIPPQMGIVQQIDNLKLVVVMIGPNDLQWSDLLKLCYGFTICDDNLTSANYLAVRAQFARDYQDLLSALAGLPGKPQVIVNLSYYPFGPTATCDQAKGPSGQILGASQLQVLRGRNDDLNSLLSAGAKQFGFTTVTPVLKPLCESDQDGTGPYIQGTKDTQPFHPTGIGEAALAVLDVAASSRE